jgi:hypothetical protein
LLLLLEEERFLVLLSDVVELVILDLLEKVDVFGVGVQVEVTIVIIVGRVVFLNFSALLQDQGVDGYLLVQHQFLTLLLASFPLLVAAPVFFLQFSEVKIY